VNAPPADEGASGDAPVVLAAGKLVGGGRALAHAGNETWLVAGALPGERVAAIPTSRRAGIVEARAVEMLGPGHPAREPAPCRHAPRCGGCDWPHVDPARGAELKAAAAAEAVRSSAALAERLRTAPVRSSPLAYRLRARLHWDPAARTLGFFEERSRRVSAIPGCRVVSNRLAQAIEPLERALAGRCPAAVDLEWLEDLEGGRAVAGLRSTGHSAAPVRPGWLPPAEALSGVVAGMHTLSPAGEISSGWGDPGVVMALPISLFVPIGSFFQGNRHLAGWLFDRVVDLTGARSVPTWDLHAGVGFLAAAAWHAGARELHLIEPARPSARAAQRNLPGASVAISSAEAALARAGSLPAEALVLTDPPRAGMTPELRRRLAGWHPDRILMLACDPATWGRDTSYLLDRGYLLTHVELVDLFPSTHHVEILAVLESG
jgi:23S rRNA (uracil1939-C5)-methyltransferase